MKNDRQNAGESFRRKVFTSILYSLLITLTAELFLVRNLLVAADYERELREEGGVLVSFADFRLVSVLLLVAFGICLFALIFWLLQRRSFVYISRISETMQAIATGDLNASVEVEGDDEFSEMAANLNSMTGDIRKLMDSERESERTKNELITNIAHDLRTPLTSIIGYLEILSKKKELPVDTRERYVEIAYTKSKKLQKLINELFGLTKLSYGKIAMRVASIDLVKLLGQLLTEFYPNFESAGLQYELESNVPALIITADPNLLARLFENLVNNAIKYGAEGKRIRVRVEAAEKTVQVRVINYGRVIPAEELPLIFEKFYRVEQSRSSSTGGTGLGLAIAQNIAEMHGGGIVVSSDLSGTAFTVTLQIHLDLNKEKFANGLDRS
ncbi:MAG: sensor histidine kinase [Stomatobaculum sp.]